MATDTDTVMDAAIISTITIKLILQCEAHVKLFLNNNAEKVTVRIKDTNGTVVTQSLTI